MRAVLPNPNGLLRDGQFVQAVVEQAQPEMVLTVPRPRCKPTAKGRSWWWW